MKLLCTVSFIVAAALAGLAQAQPKFPNKPVRIITVGPGSQGDILTRVLAPKLGQLWGQPVVVENRAGAGGTLAANAVAKATPDGYTVLLLSSQFAIGAAFHANLPYDAAGARYARHQGAATSDDLCRRAHHARGV